MRNWYAKKSEESRNDDIGIIWQLNQLINFGITDRKIKINHIRRYWNKLTLDPKRKHFIEFLLWPKQS